ncbi:MAG: cation-transporting P-type ATPase [Candidatus Altiarchaeota archaeon]|nr:cation-transporting P-type ATPase [Candidatus Altiarchaeota archaeon]
MNDAPALKEADVGIAMGKRGTDVARQAADLVITDDSFSTIVEAFKLGRKIHDNVRRVSGYVVSTNISEIILLFLGALLFGFSMLPLTSLQIIFLNLATDELPAIALGVEPNPRPEKQRPGLMDKIDWAKAVTIGIFMSSAALVAFIIGLPLMQARSVVLAAMVIQELTHTFNYRPAGFSKLLKSKWLVRSFFASAALLILVMYSPLSSVFEIVPITGLWMVAILAGIAPLIGGGLWRITKTKM